MHSFQSLNGKGKFKNIPIFQMDFHVVQDCSQSCWNLSMPISDHKGFLSAAFIDDCYLQWDSFEDSKECGQYIEINFAFGFLCTFRKKYVLEPQKKSIDLGFYLNSEDVIVTLPEDKVDKNCLCGAKAEENIYSESVSTSHWLMDSVFPAVQWGPLYYRQLEKEKAGAL